MQNIAHIRRGNGVHHRAELGVQLLEMLCSCHKYMPNLQYEPKNDCLHHSIHE